MNIEKVFYSFCEKLKEREGFLSEDNVRFYWFAAMLKQDDELNHYSLEEPYSNLKGKELDLMYYNEKQDLMCFEIKFHRKRDDNSLKNSPRTQAAGSLFNDLLRLQTLQQYENKKNVRYFFLYVNDNEMYDYLSKGEKETEEYRALLQNFYAEGEPTPKNINNLIYSTKNKSETFFTNATKSTGTNESIEIKGLKLLYKETFRCKSNSLTCINQNGVNCHVRLYEL